MAITRYLPQTPTMSSSDTDVNNSTPNLPILNVSRLFTRLEHNLLAPTADLKALRRSEYQRMRVGNNIEYARTSLLTLEKSLPGVKPVERRHEIQSDLTRKRQMLKALVGVLEEVTAQAQAEERQDDDDFDDEEEEGEGELVVLDDEHEGMSKEGISGRQTNGEGERELPSPSPSSPTPAAAAATTTAATTTPPTSTLRSRHNQPEPTVTTTATPFHHHHRHNNNHPETTPQTQTQTTEQSLASNRIEQESLTDSLLSLATQLKSSSTAFHSSLEAEKSVLDRAVDGLDATTTNMGAAEKRMGMLRRMTEGKGWWGRMMLYAWILGLWVVAIFIVFLGPKLRF